MTVCCTQVSLKKARVVIRHPTTTAREIECHVPKCEGPRVRGFPRTRHGNMFHHIIGTGTRQLHDVGLRSFAQHLRRTHALSASNLVFTSLMGVTTTNGVSHHLVLCQKKCHDMFLADPSKF